MGMLKKLSLMGAKSAVTAGAKKGLLRGLTAIGLGGLSMKMWIIIAIAVVSLLAGTFGAGYMKARQHCVEQNAVAQVVASETFAENVEKASEVVLVAEREDATRDQFFRDKEREIREIYRKKLLTEQERQAAQANKLTRVEAALKNAQGEIEETYNELEKIYSESNCPDVFDDFDLKLFNSGNRLEDAEGVSAK